LREITKLSIGTEERNAERLTEHTLGTHGTDHRHLVVVYHDIEAHPGMPAGTDHE
jgi:hypothetical protein